MSSHNPSEPSLPVATFLVRPAVADEIPILRELIDASVMQLQAEDYTVEQRENALKTVFGVDSQLVADGTYLVVEARFAMAAGTLQTEIVACGGWSKRKTLYGGDRWSDREDTFLDPQRDAAKIRAFFIHPAWARRGIGTLLLDACEKAARAAGFLRFEMGATLTGAKLFAARGYVPVKSIEVPIGSGLTLPVIQMEKQR
jgi:GNAT superfamily N-acetyltransferase